MKTSFSAPPTPNVRELYDQASDGSLFCEILRAELFERDGNNLLYDQIDQLWGAFDQVKKGKMGLQNYESLSKEVKRKPIGLSFAYSQEAYFSARAGEHDKALLLLSKSIDIDREIVTGGISAMSFHYLQSHFNIARISNQSAKIVYNKYIFNYVIDRLIEDGNRLTIRKILYDVIGCQSYFWLYRSGAFLDREIPLDSKEHHPFMSILALALNNAIQARDKTKMINVLQAIARMDSSTGQAGILLSTCVDSSG